MTCKRNKQMSSQVFKDDTLQQEFDRNGYVLVPFLDADEVKSLKTIYNRLPPPTAAMESSSYRKDIPNLAEIDQQARQVFHKPVERFFQDYRCLGTNFITKPPKQDPNDSKLALHQDWTLVDEERYSTLVCWVPLQDTTFHNGAFQLIPGSHLFSNALRCPSLPPSFRNITEELAPLIETISMKAGEALIFTLALIHCSPPNSSENIRIAATYGLVPKEAELSMYYANDDNDELHQYAMPDDMFFRFPEILTKGEVGSFLKTFKYVAPELNMEMVKKALENKQEFD